MSYRSVFENSEDGNCPFCGSEAVERRGYEHYDGWYCSNKDCQYSFDSYLERKNKIQSDKKCYIATAVYGSYDCPQVWTLRRYRDNSLANSIFGRASINVYYSVSPTIVKMFGDIKLLTKFCRNSLDKLVHKLQKDGYENTPYYD